MQQPSTETRGCHAGVRHWMGLPLLWLVAGSLAPGASAAGLDAVDGASPMRLGWQKVAITVVPPAKSLHAYPRLPPATSRFLLFKLGRVDTPIVALLDTSAFKRGTMALYVDANNDQDLTDQPPLTLAVDPAKRNPVVTAMVPMTVRYDSGKSRVLNVQIELRGTSRGDAEPDWMAMAWVAQHLEGPVTFGETTARVAVYDAGAAEQPANGCFDNFGDDRLRLDQNGDGQLDAVVEDMPLSRVVMFRGQLWHLDVDPGGLGISARLFDGPTGQASWRGANDGSGSKLRGTLEIADTRGYVFQWNLTETSRLRIPAGQYGVVAGRLVLPGRDGPDWACTIQNTNRLEVAAERTAVWVLGERLRVETYLHSGETRPGGSVCIAVRLVGSQGEVYDEMAPERSRMSGSIRIADANDIEVAKGQMEFG